MPPRIRPFASISMLELLVAAFALIAAAAVLSAGASGRLSDETSWVQFDDELDFG